MGELKIPTRRFIGLVLMGAVVALPGCTKPVEISPPWSRYEVSIPGGANAYLVDAHLQCLAPTSKAGLKVAVGLDLPVQPPLGTVTLVGGGVPEVALDAVMPNGDFVAMPLPRVPRPGIGKPPKPFDMLRLNEAVTIPSGAQALRITVHLAATVSDAVGGMSTTVPVSAIPVVEDHVVENRYPPHQSF